MPPELLFTESGLAKLTQEIGNLERALNDLLAQTAHVAEVGGDEWHDNFAYEQLKSEVHAAETKLRNARDILRQAILAPRPTSNDAVAIGTTVTVSRTDQQPVGRESWQIVGYGESDPIQGRIAYNTPLAQLLLHRRVGEALTGKVGQRQVALRIEAITVA